MVLFTTTTRNPEYFITDTEMIWVKLKSPIDKSGQVTLVVLWNSISWEIILLFLQVLWVVFSYWNFFNWNMFWKWSVSVKKCFQLLLEVCYLKAFYILLDTGLCQWPFQTSWVKLYPVGLHDHIKVLRCVWVMPEKDYDHLQAGCSDARWALSSFKDK